MYIKRTWVNAAERLPVLPDPLPQDTEDERGVVFVNRVHSSASIWYPSYGQDPLKSLHLTNDAHWALWQYEWLEETEMKSPTEADIVNILDSEVRAEIDMYDELSNDPIYTVDGKESAANEIMKMLKPILT